MRRHAPNVDWHHYAVVDGKFYSPRTTWLAQLVVYGADGTHPDGSFLLPHPGLVMVHAVIKMQPSAEGLVAEGGDEAAAVTTTVPDEQADVESLFDDEMFSADVRDAELDADLLMDDDDDDYSPLPSPRSPPPPSRARVRAESPPEAPRRKSPRPPPRSESPPATRRRKSGK